MLHWMIMFFVLAVVASILGFGGIAGTFIGIAKFLAFIFIALFVISLIYSAFTGKSAKPPL